MDERRPLILSASRRTDLPGFYPDRLVARLRNRVRRMRVRRLYGVVLWTKHPAPLLQHPALAALLGVLDNVVLQLTITGLGGGPQEPWVPRPAEVLPLLPALLAGPLRGEPARLRWRFDPLWPRPSLLDDFRRLADACARLGVPTCTVSFPTAWCQRGKMAEVYTAAGLRLPGVAERQELLGRLAEQAAARGLRLLICAQPETLALDTTGGVQPAQCVPRAVLEGLHPRQEPWTLGPRDEGQRRDCTCLPSEDLGDYAEDPCGSGCSYCYSRAGGEAGRAAFTAWSGRRS